jgi:hypothetical protein
LRENYLRTEEKSAAVFAVRRANYTHRRKGVFNVQSIEDLKVRGNVRYRTLVLNNVKQIVTFTSGVALPEDPSSSAKTQDEIGRSGSANRKRITPT